MRRARDTAALLGILLLVGPGCRPALPPAEATPRGSSARAEGGGADAPEPVSRLLGLMRDRLLLMHDVARSKWSARRPVSDPGRERDLLAAVDRPGQEHGLDPRFTRAFFAAQIDAAKRIREADFARWQASGQGLFEPAPDLAVPRGQIGGLNRQLLGALAQSGPWPLASGSRERVRAWARQVLAGAGIDEAVRDAAIAPLLTGP